MHVMLCTVTKRHAHAVMQAYVFMRALKPTLNTNTNMQYSKKHVSFTFIFNWYEVVRETSCTDM